MSRLHIADTPLKGLKRVHREVRGDTRGFLSRIFCAEELAAAGWHMPVIQINHTYTHHRGTVRGLHFQRPPHAEMKLVTCLRGAVWDIAVDLRPDSSTYLSWHAERLDDSNHYALVLPEGFAHGFQALSDDVEMLYCHSTSYTPDAEGGLNPRDPLLDIDWPLAISQLSPRDEAHPFIDNNFRGVSP